MLSTSVSEHAQALHAEPGIQSARASSDPQDTANTHVLGSPHSGHNIRALSTAANMLFFKAARAQSRLG
eukprot:15436660-Alexandrium_andersonii.AAC.1